MSAREGMDGRIGAVILAAGMSTRMGRFKPAIPLRGKPMLFYPIEVAIRSGLGPIVVVGGHCIDELRQCLASFTGTIDIVENRGYASGMASSLRCGIDAVSGRTDAALVFLADQPFVTPVAVGAMVEQYRCKRADGVRVVRPTYAGVPGHPVLFDADLYAEFAAIQGDEGGKSIIAGHRSALLLLPFEQAEWGFDADTPQDLLDFERFL